MRRKIYEGPGTGLYSPGRFQEYLRSIQFEPVASYGARDGIEVHHKEKTAVTLVADWWFPNNTKKFPHGNVAIILLGKERELKGLHRIIEEEAKRRNI